MYRHIIKQMPSIPEIANGNYRDNYLLCDLPGLAVAASEARGEWYPDASWLGGMTCEQSLKCVQEGDLAGVAPSEAFLSKLESLSFVSRKYRVVDDVVGSFPNVPNMLAGVPCAMRRRVRTTNVVAPLAVFAELSSHASLGGDVLKARGAAILALVRLLSNLRPVELWGGSTLGRDKTANMIFCRLETSPLDLARVAHVLSHPSVARGLMYSTLNHLFGWAGSAAYGNVALERKYASQILARVISPGCDVLYIPTAWDDDPTIKNPVEWIQTNLRQYGGQTVEAA